MEQIERHRTVGDSDGDGVVQAAPGGYTERMKTELSIPDELFTRGELLARRMRKSRSQLYRQALSEYIARHSPDGITEAMDRVCTEVGSEMDPFVREAGRRVLERSEW